MNDDNKDDGNDEDDNGNDHHNYDNNCDDTDDGGGDNNDDDNADDDYDADCGIKHSSRCINSSSGGGSSGCRIGPLIACKYLCLGPLLKVNGANVKTVHMSNS